MPTGSGVENRFWFHFGEELGTEGTEGWPDADALAGIFVESFATSAASPEVAGVPATGSTGSAVASSRAPELVGRADRTGASLVKPMTKTAMTATPASTIAATSRWREGDDTGPWSVGTCGPGFKFAEDGVGTLRFTPEGGVGTANGDEGEAATAEATCGQEGWLGGVGVPGPERRDGTGPWGVARKRPCASEVETGARGAALGFEGAEGTEETCAGARSLPTASCIAIGPSKVRGATLMRRLSLVARGEPEARSEPESAVFR